MTKNAPDFITEDRLKKNIGQLIAEGKLEYVDYRCYRVYSKFEDFCMQCEVLDEKNKLMLVGRLRGRTLEAISDDYGLTRECVRQLIDKSIRVVRLQYKAVTTSGTLWKPYSDGSTHAGIEF